MKVLGAEPDPELYKRHREVLDLERELTEQAENFDARDMKLDERLADINERIAYSQRHHPDFVRIL